MFVSATGDDSNPCTRTQPCRTFESTQFSVFSAGEMDALDSGDFGNVQLDRPITIDGGSGAATIALHSGNSCPTPAEAICIDIPFGTVIIRNLTLGGGITVTSADFVRVEHVIITASLGIGYNAKLGNHSLDDFENRRRQDHRRGGQRRWRKTLDQQFRAEPVSLRAGGV
jgi:hypothetical protein